MRAPAYKHDSGTLQKEFQRVYGEVDSLAPMYQAGAPTASAKYVGQGYVYTAGDRIRIYTAVTAGNGSNDWVLLYASDSPTLVEGQYRQLFIATAGQTQFELCFSYTVGSKQLLIFAGGLIVPAANVTEDSTTSFALSDGLPYGALVRVFSMMGGTYRRNFSSSATRSVFNFSFTPAGAGSQNRVDFTATAGQTLFNLGFTYTTGVGALLVFVAGLLLPTSYVAETSTSSVTLPIGMPAGTSVVVVKLDSTQSREEFTSTEGQTVFNLSFSYGVGNNELLVFVGSGALAEPSMIVETSSTSFELATPLPAGTIVRVVRM